MSESRSKISLVLQFSSLQISALEVISYFPPGYKAVKLKENWFEWHALNINHLKKQAPKNRKENFLQNKGYQQQNQKEKIL